MSGQHVGIGWSIHTAARCRPAVPHTAQDMAAPPTPGTPPAPWGRRAWQALRAVTSQQELLHPPPATLCARPRHMPQQALEAPCRGGAGRCGGGVTWERRGVGWGGGERGRPAGRTFPLSAYLWLVLAVFRSYAVCDELGCRIKPSSHTTARYLPRRSR